VAFILSFGILLSENEILQCGLVVLPHDKVTYFLHDISNKPKEYLQGIRDVKK